MTSQSIKAVGLLSGGLDSTLAAKMILEQGIDVHAINFTSPFCLCTSKSSGCASVVTAVRQLGNIPLTHVSLGEEYMRMVQSPRFGYGRGMNPCIDCRILKLQKAAQHMQRIGARFLFTGEVIGQRPKSQHRQTLELIERESGLAGMILRPLSAKLLPPTLAEREGWVDRLRLLDITGRSRKIQIRLAGEKAIADYPCPAGGCLLTDAHFAEKLRDYFRHTPEPRLSDMALLKIGRHFRQPNGDKVVVARDQREGETLQALRRGAEHLLMPHNFTGPTVLLQGDDLNGAVDHLLSYTRHVLPDPILLEHFHDDRHEVFPVAPRPQPEQR